MSTEITKQRSPNAPSCPLEDAIDKVKKLYLAIRNASVKPDVAAKSLGYSGLNGAALTVLGILTQYGLIDRSKGNVSIAPLTLNILHPKSDSQLAESLRVSALSPRVFSELFQELHECAPGVMENHLVHEGFTPEKAKIVAAVYAENKAFANLIMGGISEDNENEEAVSTQPKAPAQPQENTKITASQGGRTSDLQSEMPEGHKMLAQYTIPLGSNQATLVFTGDRLNVDDFDALMDFVGLFKTQFERAQKNAPAQLLSDQN